VSDKTQANLRRILPPILLLAVLAVTASHQNDLLVRFGNQAVLQAQEYMRYTVQIGIWLSAAYLLNRLLQVFFWEGLIKRTLGGVPPRLLRDVSGFVVYMLAITAIIGVVFNRPVTGIWATSGVAGLVIGLALRNVILDVFIGLAVNMDHPYRINDFILLQGGLVGRVTEIDWRTTRIQTDEGNLIIIPNSRIGDMVVTNLSLPNTKSEQELFFSLDFAIPTARATRILTASAMAVVGDGVLEEPEPKATIKGLSHEGVEYKLAYWIDAAHCSPGKAKHRVMQSVLEEFHQSGITPAQPKQDVFHAPMPNRQLDTRSAEDRAELLSRIELFAGLNREQLETLAMDLTQQVFSKGTPVIKQGDPGESMFIVIEGLLHAQIDFGNGHSATRVGHVRPGEFFGEMSLLTGEPRAATVVAATDTLAYEVSKSDMDSIFLNRPQLADDMSRVVAKRRLQNDDAYAKASAPEKAQHEATLARQIAEKIHRFFGAVFEVAARSGA